MANEKNPASPAMFAAALRVMRKRMNGEPMTEIIGNMTDNPELIKE